VVRDNLDVRTVRDDLALRFKFKVLLRSVLGETPLLGNNNALLTRELELGAAKSLHSCGDGLFSATDGDQDLTNVDTGADTVGLTESTTHTGLQSINTNNESLMLFVSRQIQSSKSTNLDPQHRLIIAILSTKSILQLLLMRNKL
jgi:hypothetical protein